MSDELSQMFRAATQDGISDDPQCLEYCLDMLTDKHLELRQEARSMLQDRLAHTFERLLNNDNSRVSPISEAIFMVRLWWQGQNDNVLLVFTGRSTRMKFSPPSLADIIDEEIVSWPTRTSAGVSIEKALAFLARLERQEREADSDYNACILARLETRAQSRLLAAQRDIERASDRGFNPLEVVTWEMRKILEAEKKQSEPPEESVDTTEVTKDDQPLLAML